MLFENRQSKTIFITISNKDNKLIKAIKEENTLKTTPNSLHKP